MRLPVYAFFVSILFSLQVYAFPELIRHGYVNCSACHTTQQGGDLLNSYGRELSKELLSRNDSFFKDASAEKRFLEVQTPEWLRVGADVRLLQTFSESSVASKGRFMVMQAEVAALANLNENISFYTSLARFEATKADAEWKDFLYVPALWARYQKAVNDTTAWALRAGRFYPAYGAWVAEHTFVNRRYLGLNPGEERLAGELSFSSENYQFVLTGLHGRATNGKIDPERGWTAQVSKVFGKRSRAGINMYRSTLQQNGVESKKSHEGLFALIGWSEDLSILFQLDRLSLPNGKTGVLDLMKFSYGATEGVELFFTQEYYNSDLEKSDPRVEVYGIGAQYFPVPNFNILTTFRMQKDSAQLDEFQRVVWLIGHFYL